MSLFDRWRRQRSPVAIPVVLTGTSYPFGRYVVPVESPDWRTWRQAERAGAVIEMGDSRLADRG